MKINKKSKIEKVSSAVDLPPIASNEFEIRKLEFDLWLQEYQIVHNQILGRIEADEKSYESLIITISAVVAASSLVINYKAYFLLLILSIPFHILIWDQVKRSIKGSALWQYSTKVVAPKLNSIVQGVHNSDLTDNFVGWEDYIGKGKRIVRIVRALPKSGRSALQFGASQVLVILYFIFRNNDATYNATQLDLLLICVNILVAIISVFTVSARFLKIGKRK